MGLYEAILGKTEKLSVIGLGYVGMPLAVAFAEHIDVIGFDIDEEKIETYKKGKDPTNEVGDEALAKTSVHFTSDESELKNAIFHIVAVPTPINADKTPNLTPVIEASKTVGRNLKKGAIVVYESTVYPGVTENVCIKILEETSGLICCKDFKVGYSPERINPGDQVHTLQNIVKVVSGIDDETLDIISGIYSLVVKAGTFKVSSIMTAEAIKVVENSQRDINIAFINEVALVLDMMGIDTNEVVNGMNTKWNALGFRPGLVGGHCIGVDPYYFLYEAEKLGFHSQIIDASRRINDSMGKFVADSIVRQMILAGKVVKGARAAILGLTFKEDVPDLRNTKVVDIIDRLHGYKVETIVVDPWVEPEAAKKEYGIELKNLADIHDIDCVVIAVAHKEFCELSIDTLDTLFKQNDESEKVIIDVKSIFHRRDFEKRGYIYWNL